MRAILKSLHCLLALTVVVTTLVGCDGHKGGSSVPPFPNGDANPSGLWVGNFTAADGTTRGLDMIVAPDGLFVGVVASTGLNGRLLIGTADTTRNEFSASGTVFPQPGEAPLLPNGQASGDLTVSDGSVVGGSSLMGNYSGGGESGSFALQYNGLTSRGASLNAITGVYNIYPPVPLLNIVVVVSGNTLTFASDGGCNGAGTISVIDPTMNMYSWSMLLGTCGGVDGDTYSGLATLADNPRTGSAGSLIALYGATENHDHSFVYRGSK